MTCNPGDKPTVIYNFNGGSQQKIQTQFAPIEVSTGNANNSGYRIRIESYAYGWYESSCQSVAGVFPGDFTTQYVPYIVITFCDGTEYLLLVKEGATIQYIDGEKCPGDDCKIEIKNENNETVFINIGACPCNFEVLCARCPEGQCECPSGQYPGYCCVDCGELAGEIKAIRNLVKNLNNG